MELVKLNRIQFIKQNALLLFKIMTVKSLLMCIKLLHYVTYRYGISLVIYEVRNPILFNKTLGAINAR